MMSNSAYWRSLEPVNAVAQDEEMSRLISHLPVLTCHSLGDTAASLGVSSTLKSLPAICRQVLGHYQIQLQISMCVVRSLVHSFVYTKGWGIILLFRQSIQI